MLCWQVFVIIMGSEHAKWAYIISSLFSRVCVLFKGKMCDVCGKRLTFLYTSPYNYIEYNV